MKQIYRLKRIDIIAQLLSLILPWVYFYCFPPPPGHSKELLEKVILCYFFLGGCQIMSCLINKFRLPENVKMPDRRGYEIILLILIGGCIVGFMIKDMWIDVFAVLLYISPVLALWYMVITIRELLHIRKAINTAIPHGNTDIA